MGTGERERGRFLTRLLAVNGIVATAMFTVLTVVVALQVFTRFVLHVPFIWSEEAARFLFFWVVLLGSAMSVKNRRHFVIDVTRGHDRALGPRGRFLFTALPDLFVLAFSLFLLVQGVGYAQVGLLRVAPNSQVNMMLVYAAIPVFAALTVVYSVGNLLLDYASFARGDEPTPKPPAAAE